MEFIYYDPKSLRREEFESFQASSREICSLNPRPSSTFSELTLRIRETLRSRQIGIFIIADDGDLQRLLSISPLLEDLPFILLVKTDRLHHVMLGSRLLPRFLGDIHENFECIYQILRRIAAKYDEDLRQRA